MRKQIAEADPRPSAGALDSTLGEDSAGGGSRIRCHLCIIIMGSSLLSNWVSAFGSLIPLRCPDRVRSSGGWRYLVEPPAPCRSMTVSGGAVQSG